MIGPFLFSVKKQTLCTHNACTVSRENTIFSLSIDQNRVPFDIHSKEKTR